MESGEKRCGRCTLFKPSEEFNIEHVFPDAIGGTFKVNNVCTGCNTLFNQKVDELFVKSNFVLFYRHKFKLNKRRGTIAKMVTDPVVDHDGNKRVVKERDGELVAELVDKFNYTILPDGRIECVLTIDVTKQDHADELIKAQMAQLSIELGQDLGGKYTLADVKTNSSRPISVTAPAENNLLIKQCVKIGYEIACFVQPRFIDDPTAELLRTFLVGDTITPEMREHMDTTYLDREEHAVKRMDQLNLQLHQHAVLIENVRNEGVFITVKIFNYIYPFKITSSCELFPSDDFLLVNDILTREVMSNPSVTFRLLNVHIAAHAMTQDLIEKLNTSGIHHFEFQNETLKFYREDGSLRYADHITLAGELVKQNLSGQLSNTMPIDLDISIKKLCIRTIEGKLIPVIGLSVQPLLVVLPMTPQN